MERFPDGIFTKPANVDVDSLTVLGPLTGKAGIRHALTRIGEATPNSLAR